MMAPETVALAEALAAIEGCERPEDRHYRAASGIEHSLYAAGYRVTPISADQ